ncbi:MAG: hypothetical protein JJU45_17390 [Acidimicrobiia bacterium]|nr:hypothetical protein [Acidimicrobiia bacterium]
MAASRDLRPDHHHPHPRRLPPGAPDYHVILDLHRRAVGDGRSTYRDPRSGLDVLTAASLADRGWCCDSGCRHCPFVT